MRAQPTHGTSIKCAIHIHIHTLAYFLFSHFFPSIFFFKKTRSKFPYLLRLKSLEGLDELLSRWTLDTRLEVDD